MCGSATAPLLVVRRGSGHLAKHLISLCGARASPSPLFRRFRGVPFSLPTIRLAPTLRESGERPIVVLLRWRMDGENRCFANSERVQRSGRRPPRPHRHRLPLLLVAHALTPRRGLFHAGWTKQRVLIKDMSPGWRPGLCRARVAVASARKTVTMRLRRVLTARGNMLISKFLLMYQ